MTAVEFIAQELSKQIDNNLFMELTFNKLLEQAKEMEKEQEERAYKRGQKHKKPLKDSNPINKYLKSE